MQTNRYLALTRDSGEWKPADLGFYNTGVYGWGWLTRNGGVYIDNSSDLQYNHDLDKLRLNWVGSVGAHANATPAGDKRTALSDNDTPPADWWDNTGRWYAPPGAEIVLHGEAECPYIEITRDDPVATNPGTPIDPADPATYSYWREPDGTPILDTKPYLASGNCKPVKLANPAGVTSRTAHLPFPPNGVIYAEGNIRIRGVMPPVRGTPTVYLDKWDASNGGDRLFDLQVVSGGTIYIEGDLLTPGPEGASLWHTDINGRHKLTTLQEDMQWGSRLALLARDYVCVNTTALFPRPADLYETVKVSNTSYGYNDGHPVYPRMNDTTDYPLNTYPRYLFWQGKPVPTVHEKYDGTAGFPTNPESTSFIYNNVRLDVPNLRGEVAQLQLFLGHAGWYVNNGPPHGYPGAGVGTPTTLIDPDANVQLRLMINNVLDSWEQGGDTDHYTFAAAKDPDQSKFWYDFAQGVSRLEFLPNHDSANAETPVETMNLLDQTTTTPVDTYQLAGSNTIGLGVHVFPTSEEFPSDSGEFRWLVAPHELGYVLGPIAIAPSRGYLNDPTNTAGPLPVQIQALVYAQNGSWFVIPGPWFNEDAGYATAHPQWDTQYPGYHEPLNIALQFYGAISENMPAPIGDVADWTSKWCGTAYSDTNMSLRYSYDPLLRLERLRRDPLSRDSNPLYVRTPRFKYLPMTPDLMVWGERISGQTGI